MSDVSKHVSVKIDYRLYIRLKDLAKKHCTTPGWIGDIFLNKALEVFELKVDLVEIKPMRYERKFDVKRKVVRKKSKAVLKK